MSHAITVYCSSTSDVDPTYLDAAEALGRAIASAGWSLVYGGNHVGSMGRVADGCRAGGGAVVGITPRLFADVEEFGGDLVDRACDELLLVDSMRERKRLLEERGDAFVTLPGGLGTMEEFFEVLVGRVLKQHAKPIVLLNVNGFYDPMQAMLDHAIDAGFVRRRAWDHVTLAATVEEAIATLGDQLAAPAGPA